MTVELKDCKALHYAKNYLYICISLNQHHTIGECASYWEL